MNKYFSSECLVACFICALTGFFFIPVRLSSLPLCDDVMMMSSSSSLSIWPCSVKLFHCRNVHLNKRIHFVVSFLLQYYFSVWQQHTEKLTNNPAHFKYYLLNCCGIYFLFTLQFTLAMDTKELWEGRTRAILTIAVCWYMIHITWLLIFVFPLKWLLHLPTF